MLLSFEKRHIHAIFYKFSFANHFLPQQDPKQFLALFNWRFGSNVLFLLLLPLKHQEHIKNINNSLHQEHIKNINNSQISNFFNSSRNHFKFSRVASLQARYQNSISFELEFNLTQEAPYLIS